MRPGKGDDRVGSASETAINVVAIVRALALEIHPERHRTLDVSLDSDFDRDLGFDSLSRAELLLRLGREYNVQLPDDLIGDAVTPRDLLEAIATASPERISTDQRFRHKVTDLPEAVAPINANTILEVLDTHADQQPDRLHITLWEQGKDTTQISYGQLQYEARRIAYGLSDAGLRPGSRVAIMLPTGPGYFSSFMGILMAGGIPVPIYPPFRRARLEEHIRRQAGILRNAEASFLVTNEQTQRIGVLLHDLVPSLQAVKTVVDLGKKGVISRSPQLKTDDTGLIQYTSGSTGDPKGVVLSHANLLANIRAMGEVMEAGSTDSVVSWLPLYHDMGLIGCWLGSLYFGAPACIMSPLSFIADPTRWLRAIDQHRATVTAAPNFAFELCLKRIRDEDIKGLDLSSLRRMINGAEAISPNTIKRFIERFEKFGFKPEAMAPTYGLAENSVGLAFPPLGRKPIIDRINRKALSEQGITMPAGSDESNTLEFVNCGQPLPGHQVRIVDDTGQEAPERRQGILQFKGPSATTGYFHNPQKTKELFDGDWLDSGDLAYIVGGDVYITGRIKDLIIRAGRNIYPHELEEVVGNIPGVRKGCVAVFASQDERSGSERLVVLAETRLTGEQEREKLRSVIRDRARDIVELPPEEVILAPPRTVPKTSSGKIRRSSARALFESGVIDQPGRALWWQLTRLAAAGAVNRIKRWFLTTQDYAYASYWWALLGLVSAIIWPLVIALPRRSWRHAVLHFGSRIFFKLGGMKFDVEGQLPDMKNGVVFVVNHASYLDGAVVSAAISGELTFMVIERFSRQFIAGNFLRRIGTLFVSVTADKGSKEKDETLDLIRKGERVVIFPEGRVSRVPGLLSFYMGPFIIAAEASVPVIPVTLRGTRSVLRNGGHWFPRQAPLSVHISSPIYPEGSDFDAAIALRDKARQKILEQCREPDLARESRTFG